MDGHLQVQQQGVDLHRLQPLHRLRPVRDGLDRVPAAQQELAQSLAHDLAVIRQQHARPVLAPVRRGVRTRLAGGQLAHRPLDYPPPLNMPAANPIRNTPHKPTFV